MIHEAIQITNQADNALLKDDIGKAKKLYLEAANLLMSINSTEGIYEQTSIKYSAGVLFFAAGDYQKCLTTFSSINSSIIFTLVGDELQNMVKQCRQKLEYPHSDNMEIKKLKKIANEGNVQAWERILSLLTENPYVIPAKEANDLRYKALIELDRKEEAKLFSNKSLCIVNH